MAARGAVEKRDSERSSADYIHEGDGEKPEEQERAKAQRRKRLQISLDESAVRVNRQVTALLRDQGLSESADYFGFIAKVAERRLFWHRGAWLRLAGSWILAAVAGYGYRPLRAIITYLATICCFAGIYLALTRSLSVLEAFILSATAFHGRGYLSVSGNLGNPIGLAAVVESSIGLLVEVLVIATLTQRFLSK